MKFGIRTPNIKSSVKARTTGRLKRAAKRAVNPMYGKKGMGLVNDPKKAVYNKVYNRTSVGVGDLARAATKGGARKRGAARTVADPATSDARGHGESTGCLPMGIGALLVVSGVFSIPRIWEDDMLAGVVGCLVIGVPVFVWGLRRRQSAELGSDPMERPESEETEEDSPIEEG